MTVRAVQRGALRAWEGRCHGGRREREGEEIAMNVSILPNAVGGAVFIASNGLRKIWTELH